LARAVAGSAASASCHGDFDPAVLRIGGMQLFQRKSSDRSEKVLRARRAGGGSWRGLSRAHRHVHDRLRRAGNDVFDGVCHALATISTGGFSTHDASFGLFRVAVAGNSGTLFMALGAFPFVVLINASGATCARSGVTSRCAAA